MELKESGGRRLQHFDFNTKNNNTWSSGKSSQGAVWSCVLSFAFLFFNKLKDCPRNLSPKEKQKKQSSVDMELLHHASYFHLNDRYPGKERKGKERGSNKNKKQAGAGAGGRLEFNTRANGLVLL